MNVPLRIGWIGLGNHSLQNLMPYLTEECRITAVCDIDPVRVQRFNQSYPPAVVYNNFRVMAENETLDAVFCAVSPKVHYEAGLYFALRGIPIFIEKTPCETVKQADELLAAQQKGGSFIQTGFNRRFATGYLMAKEIIERPEFGTITLFSSKFHASPYRNPGYLLTNHLIHHLDLARLLVGELDDLHIWQVMIDSQRVGYHFHAVSKKGTLVSIETSSLQDIHYPMERVEITGITRIGLCIKWLFLSLTTFCSLFPIYWTAVNSFRSNTQIYSTFRLLPESFDFTSYLSIINNRTIPTAFLNSVIITGSVMLLTAVIVLMASYGIACYRFSAGPWLHLLFTIAMFVPSAVTMGTVYKMIGKFGLLGTHSGVILVYTGGRIAFSVFLMTAFMYAIPSAIMEAAIIDGCNTWTLFSRIITPLSRNGLLVILIMAFINVWNEYMWAMIMLPSRNLRTLTVALAFFKSEYSTDYALMSAGVIFGLVPILIVYLALQDKIINGLVAASVKG